MKIIFKDQFKMSIKIQFRIAALNDSCGSEDDPQNIQLTKTKEAKEAEAFAAYNKALLYQQKGHSVHAEKLLRNLLVEHPLLQEASNLVEDEKQTSNHRGLQLLYSVHKNMASIFLHRNELESAIKSYIEAVRIDPSEVTVWYQMGQIALKLHKFPLAKICFQQALESNSKHWPSLDLAITITYALGDYLMCLEYISTALERDHLYTKGLALKKQIFTEQPSLERMTTHLFVNCDPEIHIVNVTKEERKQFVDEAGKLRSKARQLAGEFKEEQNKPMAFLEPLTPFTWKNMGEQLMKLYDFATNKESPKSLGQEVDLRDYFFLDPSLFLGQSTNDDVVNSPSTQTKGKDPPTHQPSQPRTVTLQPGLAMSRNVSAFQRASERQGIQTSAVPDILGLQDEAKESALLKRMQGQMLAQNKSRTSLSSSIGNKEEEMDISDIKLSGENGNDVNDDIDDNIEAMDIPLLDINLTEIQKLDLKPELLLKADDEDFANLGDAKSLESVLSCVIEMESEQEQKNQENDNDILMAGVEGAEEKSFVSGKRSLVELERDVSKSDKDLVGKENIQGSSDVEKCLFKNYFPGTSESPVSGTESAVTLTLGDSDVPGKDEDMNMPAHHRSQSVSDASKRQDGQGKDVFVTQIDPSVKQRMDVVVEADSVRSMDSLKVEKMDTKVQGMPPTHSDAKSLVSSEGSINLSTSHDIKESGLSKLVDLSTSHVIKESGLSKLVDLSTSHVIKVSGLSKLVDSSTSHVIKESGLSKLVDSSTSHVIKESGLSKLVDLSASHVIKESGLSKLVDLSTSHDIKESGLSKPMDSSTSHDIKESGLSKPMDSSTSHDIKESGLSKPMDSSTSHDIKESGLSKPMDSSTSHDIKESGLSKPMDSSTSHDIKESGLSKPMDSSTSHDIKESGLSKPSHLSIAIDTQEPGRTKGTDFFAGQVTEIPMDSSPRQDISLKEVTVPDTLLSESLSKSNSVVDKSKPNEPHEMVDLSLGTFPKRQHSSAISLSLPQSTKDNLSTASPSFMSPKYVTVSSSSTSVYHTPPGTQDMGYESTVYKTPPESWPKQNILLSALTSTPTPVESCVVSKPDAQGQSPKSKVSHKSHSDTSSSVQSVDPKGYSDMKSTLTTPKGQGQGPVSPVGKNLSPRKSTGDFIEDVIRNELCTGSNPSLTHSDGKNLSSPATLIPPLSPSQGHRQYQHLMSPPTSSSKIRKHSASSSSFSQPRLQHQLSFDVFSPQHLPSTSDTRPLYNQFSLLNLPMQYLNSLSSLETEALLKASEHETSVRELLKQRSLSYPPHLPHLSRSLSSPGYFSDRLGPSPLSHPLLSPPALPHPTCSPLLPTGLTSYPMTIPGFSPALVTSHLPSIPPPYPLLSHHQDINPISLYPSLYPPLSPRSKYPLIPSTSPSYLRSRLPNFSPYDNTPLHHLPVNWASHSLEHSLQKLATSISPKALFSPTKIVHSVHENTTPPTKSQKLSFTHRSASSVPEQTTAPVGSFTDQFQRMIQQMLETSPATSKASKTTPPATERSRRKDLETVKTKSTAAGSGTLMVTKRAPKRKLDGGGTTDWAEVFRGRSTRSRSSRSKKEEPFVDVGKLMLNHFPPSLLQRKEIQEEGLLSKTDDDKERSKANDKVNLESDLSKIVPLADGETEDVKTFLKQCLKGHGVLDLIFKYLLHLASRADCLWTNDLTDIFVSVYTRLRKHISAPSVFDNFEGFSSDSLCRYTQVMLAHCELVLDAAQVQNTTMTLMAPGAGGGEDERLNVSEQLGEYYSKDMTFLSAVTRSEEVLGPKGLEYGVRVNWVKAKHHQLCHETLDAIDCFQTVTELMKQMENESTRVVILPNLKEDRVISPQEVEAHVDALQRCKTLENTHALFDQGDYSMVVDTLLQTFDEKRMKESKERPSQLLLLQDSLEQLGRKNECLHWAEISIQEALTQFMKVKGQALKQAWSNALSSLFSSVERVLSNNMQAVNSLGCERLSRLSHNLVSAIKTILDVGRSSEMAIKSLLPWILLYRILQHEEGKTEGKKSESNSKDRGDNDDGKKDDDDDDDDDDEDDEDCNLKPSIKMMIEAHGHLGRCGWCTKEDGLFLFFLMAELKKIMEDVEEEEDREVCVHALEQCLFCLYNHPNKKGKAKHLQDHQAKPLTLTWERAVPVYQEVTPAVMPEFDSKKTSSISSDIEHLLRRIHVLVPAHVSPSQHQQAAIADYIDGTTPDIVLPGSSDISLTTLGKMEENVQKNLYYLLADFYMKNSELSRSVKFYVKDLAINPTRMDSWAGLALAKMSETEQDLNSIDLRLDRPATPATKKWDATMRCFQKAVELEDKSRKLWMEYGLLAYQLQAHASRQAKLFACSSSHKELTQARERRQKYLKSAFTSFTKAKDCQGDGSKEDWLIHYMLGKINEKLNPDRPRIFLEHYSKAATCLHTEKALYPEKIVFATTPPYLALEALEVFYRVHASILKLMLNDSISDCDLPSVYTTSVRILTGKFARCEKHKQTSENDKEEKSSSSNIMTVPGQNQPVPTIPKGKKAPQPKSGVGDHSYSKQGKTSGPLISDRSDITGGQYDAVKSVRSPVHQILESSGKEVLLIESSGKEGSLMETSGKESSVKEGSLIESSLKEGSLKEGSLKESSLMESSLMESSLKEGSLKEGSLKESSLMESSLKEGSLKEGSLKEGSLKESSLMESSLKEGSLKESSLMESSLKEVSLKESSMMESSVKEGSLKESSMMESSVKEGSLKESSLMESSVKEGSLKESSLMESSVKEGSLKESSLMESSVKEGSLKESSGNEITKMDLMGDGKREKEAKNEMDADNVSPGLVEELVKTTVEEVSVSTEKYSGPDDSVTSHDKLSKTVDGMPSSDDLARHQDDMDVDMSLHNTGIICTTDVGVSGKAQMETTAHSSSQLLSGSGSGGDGRRPDCADKTSHQQVRDGKDDDWEMMETDGGGTGSVDIDKPVGRPQIGVKALQKQGSEGFIPTLNPLEENDLPVGKVERKADDCSRVMSAGQSETDQKSLDCGVSREDRKGSMSRISALEIRMTQTETDQKEKWEEEEQEKTCVKKDGMELEDGTKGGVKSDFQSAEIVERMNVAVAETTGNENRKENVKPNDDEFGAVSRACGGKDSDRSDCEKMDESVKGKAEEMEVVEIIEDDDDDDDDDDYVQIPPIPLSLLKPELIINCVKGIEMAASRFSSHYKSLYRLAHFYYTHSQQYKDVKLARDLLLGRPDWQEHSQMPAPGLFYERKGNNFFQGLWKIPIDDIDRSGSFASHVQRSVGLLLDVLGHMNDLKMLDHVRFQMKRTPDTGKKYLRDWDRTMLVEKAVGQMLSVMEKKMVGPHSLWSEEEKEENLSLMFCVWRSSKGTNHLAQATVSLHQAFRIMMKGRTDVTRLTSEQAILYCQQNLSKASLQYTPSHSSSQSVPTSRPLIQSGIKRPATSMTSGSSEADKSRPVTGIAGVKDSLASEQSEIGEKIHSKATGWGSRPEDTAESSPLHGPCGNLSPAVSTGQDPNAQQSAFLGGQLVVKDSTDKRQTPEASQYQANQDVTAGQINQKVATGQTIQEIAIGQSNQKVATGQTIQEIATCQTIQKVTTDLKIQEVTTDHKKQVVTASQTSQSVTTDSKPKQRIETEMAQPAKVHDKELDKVPDKSWTDASRFSKVEDLSKGTMIRHDQESSDCLEKTNVSQKTKKKIEVDEKRNIEVKRREENEKMYKETKEIVGMRASEGGETEERKRVSKETKTVGEEGKGDEVRIAVAEKEAMSDLDLGDSCNIDDDVIVISDAE